VFASLKLTPEDDLSGDGVVEMLHRLTGIAIEGPAVSMRNGIGSAPSAVWVVLNYGPDSHLAAGFRGLGPPPRKAGQSQHSPQSRMGIGPSSHDVFRMGGVRKNAGIATRVLDRGSSSECLKQVRSFATLSTSAARHGTRPRRLRSSIRSFAGIQCPPCSSTRWSRLGWAEAQVRSLKSLTASRDSPPFATIVPASSRFSGRWQLKTPTSEKCPIEGGPVGGQGLF
jgi:hypothetical protein